jgi:hypothetical protein
MELKGDEMNEYDGCGLCAEYDAVAYLGAGQTDRQTDRCNPNSLKSARVDV